jgi:hypothetical protein
VRGSDGNCYPTTATCLERFRLSLDAFRKQSLYVASSGFQLISPFFLRNPSTIHR